MIRRHQFGRAGPIIHTILHQVAGWVLWLWLLWPVVFIVVRGLRGEVGETLGEIYVLGFPPLALILHCASALFPGPRIPRTGAPPRPCRAPTDEMLRSWAAKREGWRRCKPTFVNVVERVRRAGLLVGAAALSILVALVILALLDHGMTGVWLLWATFALIVLASLVTAASSLLLVVGASCAALRSRLRMSRRRRERAGRAGD